MVAQEMKRLAIALTLIIMASTSYAVPSKCSEIHRFATTIMDARQSGVELTRMLEIADGNQLTIDLIVDAFRAPQFNGDAFKKRSIKDFAERWMLSCIRTLRQ